MITSSIYDFTKYKCPIQRIRTREKKNRTKHKSRMKSLPPKISLKWDREVVCKANGINCIKAAIHVCNIPALQLDLKGQEFCNAIFKNTGNSGTLEPIRTYLPAAGGLTIYIFGDPHRIHDRLREIAVRVGDECSVSDVFDADIDTCRPSSILTLKLCAEAAERGGIGIIAYCRKEGR